MRSLSFGVLTIGLLATVACEKSSGPTTTITPADSAPVASSAPVATNAPTTPPAESAPPPVVASASAAPSATVAAVAAVDAGKPAKGKDAGSALAAAPLKPASKHVAGKNFALDVASPGCRAAEDCTMTIKLVASDNFHVNKEYPYKFIAAPASGVSFLGKTDPNTFGRMTGDFIEQGEKTGTLTVRFKPAAAGEAKVSGKYKLSVCSADQCLIEEPVVDLAVPVI